MSNSGPTSNERIAMLFGAMADHNLSGAAVNPAAQQTPPTTPTSPQVGERGFTHYPTRTQEIITYLAGLPGVLTRSGRQERAQYVADKLERRKNVALFIGERFLDPKLTDDITEKTAWVGIFKHTDPRYPDDPRPNPYIPSTASELSVYRRLSRLHERRKDHDYESTWRKNSFGDRLHADKYTLPRWERRLMGRNSRQIARMDHHVSKNRDRFDRIAHGEDWRGQIIDWRLQRAIRRAGR
ncbi:MAG: hypothetical protein ACYCPS_03615 [Candidatus Saccharimonadales bacterium]